MRKIKHPHLCNLRVQLLMQLAPLTHPQRRQKIPAAFFRQQAIGFFICQCLLEPRPYF